MNRGAIIRIPNLRELNKTLLIILCLFGLSGLNSLAQENKKPTAIPNQFKDEKKTVEEILSEIEINEGKETAEMIRYLHLLENLEFFQQDLDKVQILDLLILSSD